MPFMVKLSLDKTLGNVRRTLSASHPLPTFQGEAHDYVRFAMGDRFRKTLRYLSGSVLYNIDEHIKW